MRPMKCADCPRWYDPYPEKRDAYGNHAVICGMSGNLIYLEPRREPKYSGGGYMYFKAYGCNIYGSPEEALAAMLKPEKIFISEARKCKTAEEYENLRKNWPQILAEYKKEGARCETGKS